MNVRSFSERIGRVVSRETFDCLSEFVSLVLKWNARINLVGRATENSIWERHVVDSAQLIGIAKPGWGSWCDIGTGGGFPGLVIRILSGHEKPQAPVYLIESDKRKAAFLRIAAQKVPGDIRVLAARAEKLPPIGADVVSARALAPLTDLLGMVSRHASPDGEALLPKGGDFEEEISLARGNWQFDVLRHPSAVEPGAAILSIAGIKRRCDA